MKRVLLTTALAALVGGCGISKAKHNGGGGAGGAHTGGTGGAGGDDSGGTGGTGGSGGVPQDPPDLAPSCHSTDPNKDVDGDGFTANQGDCDDCNPEINPNAVEVPGDMVDNDCNGKIDEPLPTCDSTAVGKKDATEFAHSVELCDPRFFKGASTNGPSDEKARNVLANFGIIKPRVGANFALISNGVAVDAKGTDFKNPQDGTELGNTFQNPLPDLMGASDCGQSAEKDVNDYTELVFKLKAPSNARSLNFDFQFFSGEYPFYVCSKFNDEFFAIMESTKSYPKPTNVSYDQGMHPITVNSGFFTVCENDTSKPQTSHCMHPPTDNADTGYDAAFKPLMTIPGGSTGWLSTAAPVMPNEEITLRFVIFDEADKRLDSAVLIDNIRWGAKPVDPGTGPIGFSADPQR